MKYLTPHGLYRIQLTIFIQIFPINQPNYGYQFDFSINLLFQNCFNKWNGFSRIRLNIDVGMIFLLHDTLFIAFYLFPTIPLKKEIHNPFKLFSTKSLMRYQISAYDNSNYELPIPSSHCPYLIFLMGKYFKANISNQSINKVHWRPIQFGGKMLVSFLFVLNKLGSL